MIQRSFLHRILPMLAMVQLGLPPGTAAAQSAPTAKAPDKARVGERLQTAPENPRAIISNRINNRVANRIQNRLDGNYSGAGFTAKAKSQTATTQTAQSAVK